MLDELPIEMDTKLDTAAIDKVLDLISLAWGPEGPEGSCFFPWIDRSGTKPRFHEGPAFSWPEDREDIVDHLEHHQHHDLYWCPMLFEGERRSEANACEEYCLWADLDEADPKTIAPEWKPTIAWETSPGRYQAIWLVDPDHGDIIGSARSDGENRMMTYMVGADPSGWDITQLLRIPGWENHKKEYRKGGKFPRGRLLWEDGPTYIPQDLEYLPRLPGIVANTQINDKFLASVEGMTWKSLVEDYGAALLAHSKKANRMLKAKSADNEDISLSLWYLIRCLGEVGCTPEEIVALVRPTVWNKFTGRSDEFTQLANMAVRAVYLGIVKEEQDEAEELGSTPVKINWRKGMAGLKNPEWLIPDMIADGDVGYIAGEPKSCKSWVALDLAFTCAMVGVGYGSKFLNTFTLHKGGPVLYLMMEDSPIRNKSRGQRIWDSKRPEGWRMTVENKKPYIIPTAHMPEQADPQIDFIDNTTLLHLSTSTGQKWLRDTIDDGYSENKAPYALVIIDTVMRTAGDIDENKSLEVMGKLLGPLTALSKRRGRETAILLVHHFGKSKAGAGQVPQRGNQRLLGSQAFGAWAESSLFLTRGQGDELTIEAESKSAIPHDYHFKLGTNPRLWAPVLATEADTPEPKTLDFVRVSTPKAVQEGKPLQALRELGPGPHTTQQIADHGDISRQAVHSSLKTQLQRGKVSHVFVNGKTLWQLV